MCITHMTESTRRLTGSHMSSAQEWSSTALPLESTRDHLFVHMLRTFRSTGGIEREGEFLRRVQRRTAAVACSRNAPHGGIRFEWSSWVWLPLFQFEPDTFSLRPESQRVVAELAPYFDGWRLALWFAEPNVWLDNRCPVHLLETNPTYVRDAARADRFVVSG